MTTVTVVTGRTSRAACDACDWTAESDTLLLVREAEQHAWKKHGGGMLYVFHGERAFEEWVERRQIDAMVREARR